MSSDRDRFRVELAAEIDGSERSTPEEPGPNFGPFRIALIGDFSGRASRGIAESGRALAGRRPIRVDRDSIDDAIAQLTPRLRLAIAPDEQVEIAFESIDDFHPDRLYQRLPTFRALRDAADRVAAASSALQSPAPSVLDAILGGAPLPPVGGGATVAERATAEPGRDDGLSDLIARAVAPHLVATPSASDQAARSGIDADVTARMRALLHHPTFQRLEALWRGAALLVRRLDTDATLQLYLVDMSWEELAADLRNGEIEASGVYRLFVSGAVGTPGMPAWSVLTVGASLGAADAVLLTRLGSIAHEAGAVVLAGADPELAGTPDLGATPDPDDWTREAPSEWAAAREANAAGFVSLVCPRVLLRLPYGKNDEACELFDFEEFPTGSPPEHESLLWGSGAIIGALSIGEGFTSDGWSLRPAREVAGLPLHVYRVGSESFATPCAEVLLSERAIEKMLDRGLTPLAGVRDTDTVVIPRLQSIASRAAPLMGRWSAIGNGRRD